GTVSFQPVYGTNNRYTSLPGFTPTYDSNGNLLTDSFHTYTWDAEGRSTSIDSVSLTYDALNRLVDTNNAGLHTQRVYVPGGQVLMNGMTLVKGRVPLPGGADYVHDGTTTVYHVPDWLGSFRFGTNAGNTYQGL